jgi:purine-binding chemotaxis protein CheW
MKTIAASGDRLPAVVAPAAAMESGQYLTFMLAGETFALGILNIKEIIEYGALTTVPLMPDFIRGVINLRGRVVPVVDLAARFGRASTRVARRTSIVIIETRVDEGEQADGELQEVGILVDAVNEVVEIDGDAIRPPPTFGAGVQPEFIHGMAQRGSGFVILLDLNHLLSDDQVALLGQEVAPCLSE